MIRRTPTVSIRLGWVLGALLLPPGAAVFGGQFPQPLRPVLEHVVDNPDGTYTALFGYRNDNPATVSLAVGNHNKFTLDQ